MTDLMKLKMKTLAKLDNRTEAYARTRRELGYLAQGYSHREAVRLADR